MSRKKDVRVGTISEVRECSEISGRFAATIKVEVWGDEGRAYIIHVTADQIAELVKELGEGGA